VDQDVTVNEVAKLIAEFLGTFYLVLTVCLTSCDNSKPVLAVVGIASSLMVMIFALGNVSGANFNPAVSLALGMRGVLEWGPVFKYMFAQLVAAFCATSVAKLLEQSNYDLALVAVADGPLRVAARGSWGQIFGAEFFFTFLLVFVVLNVAVVKEDGGNAPNDYFGLAIGACVIVGGTAVGVLTGGCFNPAVSFGVGIGGLYAKSDGGQNGWFIVYWVAEFLAGAFAAGVARVIRGHVNSYRDPDAIKFDTEAAE